MKEVCFHFKSDKLAQERVQLDLKSIQFNLKSVEFDCENGISKSFYAFTNWPLLSFRGCSVSRRDCAAP